MLMRSKNIHLRALEPEDLELFMEIENDTSLWNCSDTSVPYSRFAIKNYIATSTNDIYADRQVRLVACLNIDDTPVAFADITNFSPRHSRAEVGIVVFPAYRCKGIATETLSILEDYAHKHVLIHTLYSIARADNYAAIKIFNKAKYKRIATLPQWLANENGSYSDGILFTKTLL